MQCRPDCAALESTAMRSLLIVALVLSLFMQAGCRKDTGGTVQSRAEAALDRV